MTSNITSIIREYGFPELSNSSQQPQKEELEAVLSGCFQEEESSSPTPVRWIEISSENRRDHLGYIVGPSHTRGVYRSAPLPSSLGWVAKLDTARVRCSKAGRFFPHAEEIAYKVSKLFRWNTVPKTKILHEQDPRIAGKNKKYAALIQPFTGQGATKTFTFQSFVEGQTLHSLEAPSKAATEKPKIQLGSFQKAYLLGSILGKDDARGDNTMLNPRSGELFEVDNELIGRECYPSNGILCEFADLKKEPLLPEVVESLLKIDPKQFLEIQAKYMKRDEQLALFWKNESYSLEMFDLENTIQEKWSRIIENFTLLKTVLLEQVKSQGKATLESLEQGVAKIREDKRQKILQMEKEAREKERLAKEAEDQARALQELERLKTAPPETNGSVIPNIYHWIKLEFFLVLHSNKKNGRAYYIGKEKSLENMRVIYVDIAETTNLLNQDELPSFLKQFKAPSEIVSQLQDRKKPKEAYHFSYGYNMEIGVFGKERRTNELLSKYL